MSVHMAPKVIPVPEPLISLTSMFHFVLLSREHPISVFRQSFEWSDLTFLNTGQTFLVLCAAEKEIWSGNINELKCRLLWHPWSNCQYKIFWDCYGILIYWKIFTYSVRNILTTLFLFAQLVFLFTGNLNDVIPECPRVSVAADSIYLVMFLKRTRKNDVFEIEYKPNQSPEYGQMLDDLTINCGLELGGKNGKISY